CPARAIEAYGTSRGTFTSQPATTLSLRDGIVPGPMGGELFQPGEAIEHLLLNAIGLVVQVGDFHFRLDVDVVLDVGPDAVLLGLPVLADQDEDRQEDGLEGHDHRQETEGKRIESGY